MKECESCFFGRMNEAEAKRFIEEIANKAAARAYEKIGLSDEESCANVKELGLLFKNYKLAKKAAQSALWRFIRDTARMGARFISRAIAILVLFYLLSLLGFGTGRIDQLTKILK